MRFGEKRKLDTFFSRASRSSGSVNAAGMSGCLSCRAVRLGLYVRDDIPGKWFA